MNLRSAIASSLVFGAVACSVSLADPAGRACDDTHACAGGRVCSAGVCVAPSSTGNLPPGPASGDAGGDTGAVAEAGATNLHPAGTFESGCGSWVAFNATATPSSTAHEGSGSCQFCGTVASYSLDDTGFLANPAAGVYHARAWVRIADGHPAVVGGVLLRTVNRPSGKPFDEVELKATNVTLTAGWAPVDVTLTVTRPAEILNVVVYGNAPTCILVDDVSVEKLP